jgi:ribonuclease P protein component
VGRTIGGAVQRNRARRRLRAAVVEVADRLDGGAYLFGAGRDVVTMPFAELVERVGALVDAARETS